MRNECLTHQGGIALTQGRNNGSMFGDDTQGIVRHTRGLVNTINLKYSISIGKKSTITRLCVLCNNTS